MEPFFFSEILIEWYERNKRVLPWRETSDPYLIWISEIILQQTRVAQGLDYYYRFTERFPDVKSLAEAREEEVLKYWQGLGYYSRARNLHAAAKDIQMRFGGKFPDTYREILSLKGIGEYTAAAISSFVWEQPYPVLDGNVYRVLSRVFGVDLPIDSSGAKKYFTQLAGELLNTECPGLHNQAIMEFGALQCVPKSPDCTICPLNHKCLAFASGTVDVLPVKKGKVKTKSRYFNYLDIHCRGERLLVQRQGKDIWQNLYEFPLIETDEEVEFGELQQTEAFKRIFSESEGLKLIQAWGPVKHVLSHRTIYARFYALEVEAFTGELQNYIQVSDAAMDNYAVSRLIQLYLENKQSK
ncbi:A/G-specific adenine glycosylase [Odoribacter sp. OttesenSCG-928-J03]|nr:A/G-specific adenine glycosylase [Odoribacter sp. OttesenSCG-928-J03]MDL2283244.1 A/G-specific adenine glycosylase [Odoribacter sp. OttesenSCG-928-G04]